MRILFSVQKARYRQFGKSNHNLLKTEVSVTFSNSPEILTVFVSKAIKDKSGKLVHSLAVMVLGVSFEEGIDDSSEAIKVVSFTFLLLFRQMHFSFGNSVFCKCLLEVFYFEFLKEKLTVWFCPFCVFFDEMPKLLIFKKGLPFGLFE